MPPRKDRKELTTIDDQDRKNYFRSTKTSASTFSLHVVKLSYVVDLLAATILIEVDAVASGAGILDCVEIVQR